MTSRISNQPGQPRKARKPRETPARPSRHAGSAPALPAVLLLLALTGCGRGRPAAVAAAGRGALPVTAVKDVEIKEDPVKTGIDAGDAGLAAQVRARLAADSQTRRLRLEVDAESGRITLWGHVGSAADRSAAEAVARRTAGVSSVVDLLKVDGAGRADGAGETGQP